MLLHVLFSTARVIARKRLKATGEGGFGQERARQRGWTKSDGLPAKARQRRSNHHSQHFKQSK